MGRLWGAFHAVTVLAIAVSASPSAAISASDRCEAGKLTVSGKYALCRLKAEAKAVKKGLPPDYAKCDERYALKWAVYDGGDCPSIGDEAQIQSFITQHTDDLATALGGGSLPGPSRRLKTGQSTCYDTSGGLIPCAGTGQDGETLRGLSREYVDNGDGTITDTRTGLTWEKLSDDGSIHDWDATYTWSDALSVFIPALNAGGGFAGYTDWRLPNRSELESIADLGRMNPAIDPIFHIGCAPGCSVLTCSCTSVTWHYWTSNSNFWSTTTGWLVYFVDGDVNAFDKSTLHHVRAVRGGL